MLSNMVLEFWRNLEGNRCKVHDHDYWEPRGIPNGEDALWRLSASLSEQGKRPWLVSSWRSNCFNFDTASMGDLLLLSVPSWHAVSNLGWRLSQFGKFANATVVMGTRSRAMKRAGLDPPREKCSRLRLSRTCSIRIRFGSGHTWRSSSDVYWSSIRLSRVAARRIGWRWASATCVTFCTRMTLPIVDQTSRCGPTETAFLEAAISSASYCWCPSIWRRIGSLSGSMRPPSTSGAVE